MQTGEQWAAKPAPGSSDAAWLRSHLENVKVALWQPSAAFWQPLPQVVAPAESSQGSCRSSLGAGQLLGHAWVLPAADIPALARC